VPADRREVIQIPDPMFADVHNEGMNGLLLWMVATVRSGDGVRYVWLGCAAGW